MLARPAPTGAAHVIQIYILAGAVAAALAAGGAAGYALRDLSADRDIATLSAQHAQAVASAASAGQTAERDARAVEQRRYAALQEIVDAAQSDHDRAATDAARARAAAVSLRGAAQAAAARCDRPAGDPAPAPASAAAAGPGLVLADVFGRADDRSGELAEALDRARGAGLACERAYDALNGVTR